MADLDAQIRARLAWLENAQCFDDQGCDFQEHDSTIFGMRAALLAVLEMLRRAAEDWTNVSETAYDAGRRWALEQAVSEIAEKLGIEAPS
jgi:hypothetical protein